MIKARKLDVETVTVFVYSDGGKVVGSCPVKIYQEITPGVGSAWYRVGPPREFEFVAKKKFRVDRVVATAPANIRPFGVNEVLLPNSYFIKKPIIEKGGTVEVTIPECLFTFKDTSRGTT
jgi:hypothetical protein